jgi:hypothetical protein
LKNKDQTKVESLKTDLLNELAKLNKYLENQSQSGNSSFKYFVISAESAIILFSFLLSTSTGTFPSVFNPPNSTGLFAMSTGSIFIFPKLATLLKNKDQTKVESLKTDLLNELAKLNKYLENDTENGKYLIGDDIAEIDCMLLPRLRHVKVAGGHFAGLEIPDEMTGLHRYIEEANKNDIYRATCCPDEEIVKGWSITLVPSNASNGE